MPPPSYVSLIQRVLVGLDRRARMLRHGLPPAFVPYGMLNLDGSPVVECPYSGLRFRAPGTSQVPRAESQEPAKGI